MSTNTTENEQPTGEQQTDQESGEQVEQSQQEQQSQETSTEESGEQQSEENGEQSQLSHEDALAALKSTRKSEARTRQRLKTLEDQLSKAKSEDEVKELIEASKAESAEESKNLVRENVALRHGLPDDLAEVIKGETREEMDEHAKRLAQYVSQSGDATPDQLGGGLDPNQSDQQFDPKAVWSKVRGRRR